VTFGKSAFRSAPMHFEIAGTATRNEIKEESSDSLSESSCSTFSSKSEESEKVAVRCSTVDGTSLAKRKPKKKKIRPNIDRIIAKNIEKDGSFKLHMKHSAVNLFAVTHRNLVNQKSLNKSKSLKKSKNVRKGPSNNSTPTQSPKNKNESGHKSQ
jgi:hypothetical protein